MTARAWITGGVKNFSDSTAWNPNGTPAAGDVLTFPAASTGTLTIDGTSGSPNLCRSIDFTGFTGTLSDSATSQLNIGDASGGSLKLVSGMTYSPNGAAVIKFVSTTSGNQITWGGKIMPLLTFDGVGGSWQFQDAPNSGGTSTITLTNGSLDINGKAVTANLSSNNPNTRSLTLGAMTWTSQSPATWDISNATGMTLSASSSTISFVNTTGAGTFQGGGLSYGTLTSAISTGTTVVSGSNTFATLTLNCGGVTKTTTSGYSISGTQTVTGTFTSNGNTTLLRNFIYGTTLGTPAIISAATVTVTHTDFRDITGAGAGSWNFSGLTTTANGNAGGNSGITFTTPKNCFMKTAVSVNWSASNWFTASGGSTAIVPAMPLVHDNCKFDINSVTAGSKTITLDEPRVPDVTWAGVANTPAFATSTAYEIYGNIILVSGMTHTGGVAAGLMGRGSFSLDGGTLTWPASSTITLNAPGSTYSLSRNFTSSAGLTVTAGTWAQNGFTSNVTAITPNGGTISGTGAITGTTYTQSGGTVTLGGTLTLTGAFALSAGTFNNNNFGVTGHTTFAVSGTGVLNLSAQFNGSTGITVSGGTINDSGASGELKGTTASFTGGTSVVRKLTLSSTFAMSATANLTFPTGGNATWATSWTQTGTTHTLDFKGVPNFTNGALTVGSPYVASLEGY